MAFRPWFRGAKSLVDQARRQVAAAAGVSNEWFVAEDAAATAIGALLEEAGFGDIVITVVGAL